MSRPGVAAAIGMDARTVRPAMVGARMANLKVGNPVFGNAISSMETIGVPAITIERAAELSGVAGNC